MNPIFKFLNIVGRPFCVWLLMGFASITAISQQPVDQKPTIKIQPQSLSVALGQSATFRVEATGSGRLGYQWYRGEKPVVGATNTSYTIQSVQLTHVIGYFVVVTNSVGSVTSAMAKLSVLTAKEPPKITVQPVSVVAVEGKGAKFTVTVTGSAPLTYQWRKNGVALSGAVGASLGFESVKGTDVGEYQVVVKNDAGSVTSSVAKLTLGIVSVGPKIVVQPLSVSVALGHPASFRVEATGTGTLGYQWYRGEQPIVGAIHTSYTIQSVQLTDVIGYSVVVTNSVGRVTSAMAKLTILTAKEPPKITVQPVSVVAVEGKGAKFTVTVTGSAPFKYQWRKNGVALSDAVGASFGFESVKGTDVGEYQVVVKNDAGSVTSAVAKLTLGSDQLDPSITEQPKALTVVEGQTALFSVTVKGTPLITYQWKRDGHSILNATNSTFTITNTHISQSGDYLVVISNSKGSVTSRAVNLKVTSRVANLNIYSLSLGMDQGLAKIEESIHSAFFTTFDGVPGEVLYEKITEGFLFSDELSSLGETLEKYHTDYAVFVGGTLNSIGTAELNIANTDADVNAVPDFLQVSQIGSVSFDGTFTREIPDGPTVMPMKGQITRAAGKTTGRYVANIQDPKNGLLTYSGNSYVRNVVGSMAYERVANTARIEAVLGIEDGDAATKIVYSGNTEFKVVDVDSIYFPATFFKLSNGQALESKAFKLQRSGKRYIGTIEFTDGQLDTPWRDYTHWRMEIVEANDSDNDGIPDLSDSVLLVQPNNSTTVSEIVDQKQNGIPSDVD